MKKLLICCLAIYLAMVPVSTAKAAVSDTTSTVTDNDLLIIDSNGIMSESTVAYESYSLSPDASSMYTTITMDYQGEVTPAKSVNVTRIIDGNTYSGTVYLTTFRYLDGITTATYAGTLYLQSSASTS